MAEMCPSILVSTINVETCVQSRGWEDRLEKEMATCSSILAWKTPWTEGPGRLQSMGHREWDTAERLTASTTWNLGKWCRWTYLQVRTRHADREKGHPDTVRRGRGVNWETGIDVYRLSSVKCQGYSLPSGHAELWDLDHKEGRVSKNWCLWTVALEKTPESPLDSKEIKPVTLKGNQPWIFTGRTDAEAEAPVFWSSDANRQLIGKVPDAGKDWGQKEKRASEDEIARQHHRSNEHELWQTLGDGEGQGGLACCSPSGRKESDTTEQLNWLTDWRILLKQHTFLPYVWKTS